MQPITHLSVVPCLEESRSLCGLRRVASGFAWEENRIFTALRCLEEWTRKGCALEIRGLVAQAEGSEVAEPAAKRLRTESEHSESEGQ